MDTYPAEKRVAFLSRIAADVIRTDSQVDVMRKVTRHLGDLGMSPRPEWQEYLEGGCTESECRLCRTPVNLRKRGQFHAGISGRKP
jgi:hypothetical protein